MTAMHFVSPPTLTSPICGQRTFHSFMVTADATKITCKNCLRIHDWRMSAERLRRRREAAS